MVREPKVSVIVPVYNVSSFLRAAIESVVRQTYTNLEILIIDDGSTDGSEKICDEYTQDQRVRVIHQRNQGLSGARNTGLDLMTGEVVAFLDSDDYFYPEMIAKTVEVMTERQADIVICDFEWNGRTCNLVRKTYSSIEAQKVLISGKMELAVWNKIYRKEIWDDIRFPQGHNYEGTRTTYKLLHKAAIIEVISDCLIFHRTRSGSIVQTPSKNNIRDFILACEEFEGYVLDNTPELFTEQEIARFTEWRFLHKMAYWKTNRKTDPELKKKLEKNILENSTYIRLCSNKTKIKYLLLRFFPNTLGIIVALKDKLKKAEKFDKPL